MIQEKSVIQGISFKQLNGAWIAEDTILGNNVTILPGAVLGRPPLSTKAQARQTDIKVLAPLTIGDNCVIGANVDRKSVV